MEDVSRSVSCLREEIRMNTLSQKVRRYTTFIRDILELAQPKNIPTGIKLHNILDENSVNDVMDSINDINETIYHNDPSKFLTWAKGFISQLKFHPKTHIVTMKIRIQIPLAYWQDLMPIYMVYQIGFIPAFGGPCSRLNLPNILARKNGTFHEVQCPSDDCRDGHITTMSPSCLKNGSNISCPLILSHCKQLSSFVMDDGILLTTYHKIFTVDLAGLRIKLTHNGSVFISWHGLSRIEVEGDLPDKYHKTFFPPMLNVTLKAEIIPESDKEDMRYTWLDIYHANHSLENDIMRMTIDEVQLIKKEAMPRTTHLSIWASVVLFFVAGILVLTACWRKKFKNTVLIQTSRV